MSNIPDLTNKPTPTSSDKVEVYDVSSNSNKHSTLAGIASAVVGSTPNDTITGAMVQTQRTRLQSVTTNTDEKTVTIQEGWGFVTGTGTGSVTKAVTFPVSFSSLKMLKIGMLAARTTTDPTAISDLNVAINGDIVQASFNSLGNSGFTANVTAENGRTLGSGVRYGFWWEAKGVV